MVDFAQALAKGNAHVEYVWHVGGMPWAVATSNTIITAIGAAHRATMFGLEYYGTIMDPHYFGTDVDIYPILQVPGAQTVKVEDGFGNLDGGTWTAQVADLPVAPTWPHGNRTIWGLEGIQAIANPRVDNTIKSAKLAGIMAKADTTVKFTDDIGAALYTAINAASTSDPFVAWIGGECLAFVSCVDNSDGSYTATTSAAWRGLLNSKTCYHAPNRLEDGAPAERIMEQPLNGIVGRPQYLWAFVLDDTNTIISGPVKFRHGKVGSDVKFDGSFWSVQCLPWWKWIDTEINMPVIDARMSRYILSRPDTDWGPGADQAEPHLRFREYLYSTNTWSAWTSVWIGAEGATTFYDDIAELEQDLVDAMNVASPNSWKYTLTEYGPVTWDLTAAPAYDVDSEQDWFFIAGHLPFILNWGWGIGGNGAQHQNFRYHCHRNEWNQSWIGSDFLLLDGVTNHSAIYSSTVSLVLSYSYEAINDVPWFTPKSHRARPRYILQWRYDQDTLPGGWSELTWLGQTRQFPIPSTDGDYKIYIDPKYDVTNINATSVIQVGAEDIMIGGSEDAIGLSTLSKFQAASAGAGGEDNNYIVAGLMAPDTGLVCIDAKASYEETEPKCIFYPGQMLFYSTHCQLEDPWPIIQSFDLTAETLGDMYQAILGETVVGCTVAEEIQRDIVPDHDTIDWSLLDEFVTATDLPFGVNFQLRYTGKLNLWGILLEELKFYGLNPTWEWDVTLNQYLIRFRKVGSINSTMAYLNGHRIDENTIEAGSKVVGETADTWQLNAINLSMNWDPIAEEFSAKYTVLDRSGYAPTGGKINTLDIEPRITQIPDLATNSETQANLVAWFSNHLDNMMYPRPSQNCSATLYQCMQMGVGTDVMVTCDNIHNPFTGEVGITEYPCLINEMTIDPSKSTAKYNYLLAARLEYGWAPSCLITASTWNAGTHTATVTAIGGSGQEYCGSGITSGWYDHWFFADYAYNASLTEPETISSTFFYATAVEYGSKTPQVITGIKVATVSKLNYTDALAAGNFMTLVDATDAWNTAKDYYLIYEAHNSAVIADEQKKYVFIAGNDGQLLNSDATVTLTREWT